MYNLKNDFPSPRITENEVSSLKNKEPSSRQEIFNDTYTDNHDNKNVHAIFESRAAQTPDKIALIFEDEALSYNELNLSANRIGNYLLKGKMLAPEEPVGILLNRSTAQVTAMLGILKAGGTYVPLDPSLPEERIGLIIRDARIKVIISEKRLIKTLNRLQWECDSFTSFICLDSKNVYAEEENEKNHLMNVELWKHLGEKSVDDITGGGWFSSYTGLPFSQLEMEEFSGNVLKKLDHLLHRRMRVLDIGVASGVTMFNIAPRVGFYYGTDLSPVIIEKSKTQAAQKGFHHISLETMPAHQIHRIREKNFDLVIINSVIQCFHGHNYLRNVLKKIVSLMSDTGWIFIGDVMDQQLKTRLVEDLKEFKRNNRGKGFTTKTDVSEELFVDRQFFRDLRMEIQGIGETHFSSKIHTVRNELTRFRYDALIRVDKHTTLLPESNGTTKVKQQEDMRVFLQYGTQAVKRPVKPNQSAYVLYTSGSTGTPKGVVITHRNLLAFVEAFTRKLEITAEDRKLQFAPVSFDASVSEIYPMLLNGGTLVQVRKTTIGDHDAFLRYLTRHRVTCLTLPPLYALQLGDCEMKYLRILITGGSAPDRILVERWRKKVRYFNGFGPTETTVACCMWEAPCQDLLSDIPAGPPLHNLDAYILDEAMKQVPVGVPGELCISGTAVARGYLNRPELTAEKFIMPQRFQRTQIQNIQKTSMHPWSSAEKLYRTGDMARWRSDGTIEFLGRIDFQVKIRGFRIELGEIEHALLNHDTVREAVVIDRNSDDVESNLYLCAYVVPKPGETVEPAELRDFLSETLPNYMIPSFFMQLTSIPLTHNDKVNRSALPDPRLRQRDNDYISPSTLIEETLVNIWADVLKMDKWVIGAAHHFFQLGGHSLKATQLTTKIHQSFHVKMTVNDIFRNPKIRQQAKFIACSRQDTHTRIEAVEKKDYYPQSPAQKRLFIIQQTDRTSTGYNTHIFNIHDSRWDVPRMKAAFKEMIRRHESLRTSFLMTENEAVQRVHDFEEIESDIHFEYHPAVSSQTDNGQPSDSNPIGSFVRPFELSSAPLIRMGIIDIEENRQIHMVDMHHIITDGVSGNLFINQLKALYNGEHLVPLRIQYKDFAVWLDSTAHRQRVKQQEKFWFEEFSGDIPVLELPTDYKRQSSRSFDGSTVSFTVDKAVTGALKRLAGENGATLYMMLLVIYNILLSRVSGQEDMVTGTSAGGRSHTDLQQIMGIFVNTLAIHTFPSGNKTAVRYLEEVRQKTLFAFDNQDYPFDQLVSALAPRRDSGRNPLFDVYFGLQNQLEADENSLLEVYIPEKSRPKSYQFKPSPAKFDLTLLAVETDDGLRFSIEYDTGLFRVETVRRYVAYFIAIATNLSRGLEQQISAIPMLPEAELQQLLSAFNSTRREYPRGRTIHSMFEEQVERVPHRVAVDSNRQLTYRQLNIRANIVARRLKRRGLGPGILAAILLDRSDSMIIAMLAVLKAGGAYIPLDPTSPSSRQVFIIKDSSAGVLLTRQHLIEAHRPIIGQIPAAGIEEIDSEVPIRQSCLDSENLPMSNTADHPAYIIYTSGTTGRPKGVVVEHRGIVSLNTKYLNEFGIRPWDNVIQFAASTFDASVSEIYMTLLNGARLCIIQSGDIQEHQLFLRFMNTRGITVATFPPVFARHLEPWDFPSLRLLVTAGSEAGAGLVNKWKSRLTYVNAYGPTETTICATIWTASTDSPEIVDEPVPIGKPIPNTSIFILDPFGNPVPVGTPGELCVSGTGLARGYLNRPELTAEKFVVTQRSQQTQSKTISKSTVSPEISVTKIYKTGDLASWQPDGNIRYLGRIDRQVKVRGYRIEPAEIEARLREFPGISDSAVIDWKDRHGDTYLCAYIITGQPIHHPRIRSALLKYLPEYMIPARYMTIDELPLTTSGKVNRNALPEPVQDASTGKYIPPENKIQQQLVRAWQEVLGIERIGIDDDFFQLGGDSIKALQLSALLRKNQMKLEVRRVFINKTIRQLTPHIAPLHPAESEPANQQEVIGDVPLTPIQRWFFQEHTAIRHNFNQSMLFFSKEGFEEEAVRTIMTRLTEHHDALRMVFRIDKTDVHQYNPGIEGIKRDAPHYSLKVIQCPHPPTIQQSTPSAHITKKIRFQCDQIQQSFDLETGPLVKALLFKSRVGDYLALIIHHLVVDGVSWRILVEDLKTALSRIKRKKAVVLPPKTASFRRWAQALTDYARSPRLLRERPYWKAIESADVPELPADHDTPLHRLTQKTTLIQSIRLDTSETRHLLTHAHHPYDTDINDLLLTALGLTLHKWCGINRTLINLEGHGREDIVEDLDIHRTVGWFTTQYPILLQLDRPNDLSHSIKQVKAMLRRIPEKGIGYGLLKFLSPTEIQETPLNTKPSVSFNYLGQFDSSATRSAAIDEISAISDPRMGNSISPDFKSGQALDIIGITRDGQLEISIYYNTLRYRPQTIEKIAGLFRQNLRQLTIHCMQKEEPEVTIQSASPLSPFQREMFAATRLNRQAYLIQNQLTIPATTDNVILQRSLDRLIQNHEILRTRFTDTGTAGEPVQEVLTHSPVRIDQIDLSHMEPKDRQRHIEIYKEEDREAGFDISNEPSMRFTRFITPTEETKDILIWTLHHIIMDGWSLGIFLSELTRTYETFSRGEAAKNEAVLGYREYIRRQYSQDTAKSLAYWRQYLAECIDPGRLSALGNAVATGQYRLGEHYFTLDAALTHRLTDTASRHRVTLNVLLQAIWGKLLQHRTNSSDVVFASVTSVRPPEFPHIERLMGLCINMIPVRINTTPDDRQNNFGNFLIRIQQQAINSKPYEYTPLTLTDVMRSAKLDPDIADTAMFFENYPETEEKGMQLQISLDENHEYIDKSLCIYILPKETINIRFSYNAKIYNASFIEQLAIDFELLALNLSTE